jgi:hypothetical protein
MGVRTYEPDPNPPAALPRGPSLASALGWSALSFVLLVSNGRPIGAGDTRPTERVAASLVQEGDFDLDEYPEVEPPFAREEGGRRVSIYPVLSAVLAAPVFLAARAAFVLDETGTALAGKWAAALFSALAAGVLYLAVGRRQPTRDAAVAALVFALGTSVCSTSQALWQHPAAVLFVCLALLFWLKAEDGDPAGRARGLRRSGEAWISDGALAWAGRAGLPLALAVAARPADVAVAAALGLGFAARWPKAIPRLALWASPVVLFVLAYQWWAFGAPLRHGFSGTLSRFSEPWGVGQLGLLLSPAKGLFVFTPVALVALVGLARALRRADRALPLACGAAFLAHLLLTGRWSEWHGGESWGPRLLTGALPVLFLFLPEGLTVTRLAGTALAIASVGVQALGAFAYDYRWERLHQRGGDARAALRDVARNPILFHLREGVVRPALPGRRGDKAMVREHPLRLFGPSGSRVVFEGGLRVDGSERTLGNVLLERGARVEDGRLRLRGRFDALFFRVPQGARPRALELRVEGRGRGTLYVGERAFSVEPTKWTAYPMNGAFRVRHPYTFKTSGGPDLRVSLGKDGGEADLVSVALVPEGEPEDVFRLGGR